MDRKFKQASRKRKAQTPEEDDKNTETLLEEVKNISGKNMDNTEEKDGSPPAKGKRSANKKTQPTTPPKKSEAKKTLKNEEMSDSSPSPSKQKKSTDEEKEATVDADKTSTASKGDLVPNLPDGWRRQAVVRKSGKTAGQIDIYFYSPEGQKLRSRPDVASYLEKKKIDLKVEMFDFSKASKIPEPVGKKKNIPENNITPKKRGKADIKSDGVDTKDSPKAIKKKLSKVVKSPTKVPPVADEEEEENNTEVLELDKKKIVIKVLPSKKKRLRK